MKSGGLAPPTVLPAAEDTWIPAFPPCFKRLLVSELCCTNTSWSLCHFLLKSHTRHVAERFLCSSAERVHSSRNDDFNSELQLRRHVCYFEHF